MQKDVGRVFLNGMQTLPCYVRDLCICAVGDQQGPGTSLPPMLRDNCINNYTLQSIFLWPRF
jgi:hypothetical protein